MSEEPVEAPKVLTAEETEERINQAFQALETRHYRKGRITKFVYFAEDGTKIVQPIGEPAYLVRRKNRKIRRFLREEGLEIPDFLREPVTAFPKQPEEIPPPPKNFPVPQVQLPQQIEPMLEPFEVPTKENTEEPWALIIPPKKFE